MNALVHRNSYYSVTEVCMTPKAQKSQNPEEKRAVEIPHHTHTGAGVFLLAVLDVLEFW
jgi:hypothetical protein